MKRQLKDDENTPCSSKSMFSRAANAESAENSTRARKNWASLSTKIREALTRKEIPMSMSTGLFRLEKTHVSSSLDESLMIMLPENFNRSSPDDLTGFDNTGNVRLWPGGEGLTGYLLQNPHIVVDKLVLELGAGRLGLPGLIAARNAKTVCITDGNEHSANVLASIISENSFPNVTSQLHKWGDASLGNAVFDLILAADCIFFKENHKNFLDTCATYLAPSPNSVVFICSPPRKGSLTAFLNFVKEDGRFTSSCCSDFGRFVLINMSDLTVDNAPFLYVLKRV